MGSSEPALPPCFFSHDKNTGFQISTPFLYTSYIIIFIYLFIYRINKYNPVFTLKPIRETKTGQDTGRILPPFSHEKHKILGPKKA